MFPSITCLSPTYGRPTLLANAIACFLAQDYPRNRCRLMICDDLGTIRGLTINDWTDEAEGSNDAVTQVENVFIFSTKHRYFSLPEKYNALWKMSPLSDIYLVWEDDDCQLPWCLSSHAKACEQHGWSYPTHVWSDYGGDLHMEPSGGRFHGSLGIRGDTLTAIGGWPLTRQANFDQQMISRLRQTGEPGDPIECGPTKRSPAYVFRWHTGQQHGQSVMKGPEDESWYDNYEPPDSTGPHIIVPALDADSKKFYELLTSSS